MAGPQVCPVLMQEWGPWSPDLLILPLVSCQRPHPYWPCVAYSMHTRKEGASCLWSLWVFCSLRLSTDSTSLLPLTPLSSATHSPHSTWEFIADRKAWDGTPSLLYRNSCQWECSSLLPEDTAHPSPPTRGRPYRLLPPSEGKLIKAGAHIYSCVLLCTSNCLMHSKPCTEQVLGLEKRTSI